MARKPRLQGRIDPRVLDKFSRIKTQLDITGRMGDSRCLAQVLDAFEHRDIGIDEIMTLLAPTPEQERELNEGLTDEHANIWADILQALLALYRTRKTDHHASERLIEDASERKRRHMGAYEHIDQAVRTLMAANDAVHDDPMKHSLDIVYLSPGMVQRLVHSNFRTIKEYFRLHHTEIESHNQNNGIASEQAGLQHNLLRAKYLQAQERGEGEAFAARYALRSVTVNGYDARIASSGEK